MSRRADDPNQRSLYESIEPYAVEVLPKMLAPPVARGASTMPTCQTRRYLCQEIVGT